MRSPTWTARRESAATRRSRRALPRAPASTAICPGRRTRLARTSPRVELRINARHEGGLPGSGDPRPPSRTALPPPLLRHRGHRPGRGRAEQALARALALGSSASSASGGQSPWQTLEQIHFHEVCADRLHHRHRRRGGRLRLLESMRSSATGSRPGRGLRPDRPAASAPFHPGTLGILKRSPAPRSPIRAEPSQRRPARHRQSPRQRFEALLPLRRSNRSAAGAGTKKFPDRAQRPAALCRNGGSDRPRTGTRSCSLEVNLDDVSGEIVGYTKQAGPRRRSPRAPTRSRSR